MTYLDFSQNFSSCLMFIRIFSRKSLFLWVLWRGGPSHLHFLMRIVLLEHRHSQCWKFKKKIRSILASEFFSTILLGAQRLKSVKYWDNFGRNVLVLIKRIWSRHKPGWQKVWSTGSAAPRKAKKFQGRSDQIQFSNLKGILNH